MESYKTLYAKRTPIKEIVKLTGISKATLWRKLKNEGLVRTISDSRKGMKMSDEQKEAISKSLKGRFTGKSNWNTIKIKENYEKMTSNLSYIMGVMLGDGYITASSGIGLESIDKDFVDKFNESIIHQFGIKSKIYHTKKSPLLDWRNGKTYKRSDTYILRASSVLLRDFIKRFKSEFNPNELNKNMKIYFLRGLWDSEGSVNQSGFTNTVNFTHNTKELCQLFQSILMEVAGIKTKMRLKPQGNYVLYFYRKEYIKAFYDIIKPTIKRKRAIFEKIINS